MCNAAAIENSCLFKLSPPRFRIDRNVHRNVTLFARRRTLGFRSVLSVDEDQLINKRLAAGAGGSKANDRSGRRG